MADTEWLAAGFEVAQYGILDADGRILGREDITGSTPGYSSNLGRLRGAIAAPFQINDPEIQKVLDKDRNLVSVVGDAQELSTFILEVAAQNIEFRAAADGYEGALNNRPASRIYYPNIQRGASRRYLYLLFARHALLYNTDDDDQQEANWAHLELMRCEAHYLGSGYAFQEVASFRFLVVCHEQDVMPDGRSFESFFGVRLPGDLLDSSEFYSELPVSAVATSGRTTPSLQTTLLPAYTPYSVGRTSAAVDGVAATVSSVSGTITLSAGWDATKRAISFYQTEDLLPGRI